MPYQGRMCFHVVDIHTGKWIRRKRWKYFAPLKVRYFIIENRPTPFFVLCIFGQLLNVTPVSSHLGIGDGVVVTLLVCRARGPGFEPRSCLYDFSLGFSCCQVVIRFRYRSFRHIEGLFLSLKSWFIQRYF